MTKWTNHSRRLFIQKHEQHYSKFQFNDVVFKPLAKACGIAELMREYKGQKFEIQILRSLYFANDENVVLF